MADVKEIYSHLDSLFPRSLSCSWDNDGLMVCPDSSGKVKKVLLALDITQKVANEAICGGYDVVISHHPLIFRPLRQLSEEFAGAAVPMKLFSARISVISLHTRFDAGEGGINDTLASLLGFDVTAPFGEEGEMCGRLCKTEKTTVADFCKKIKSALGCPCVACGDTGKTVETVAICGGDGKSFVPAAVRAGADAFLTGASGYNAAIEAADMGLCVIDAGHYHTEFLPFVTSVQKILSSAFPEVETKISSAGCEISCF